jgi:hypothetical protein
MHTQDCSNVTFIKKRGLGRWQQLLVKSLFASAGRAAAAMLSVSLLVLGVNAAGVTVN